MVCCVNMGKGCDICKFVYIGIGDIGIMIIIGIIVDG